MPRRCAPPGVAAQIEVVPNARPGVAGRSTATPARERVPRVAYLGGFANPAKGGDLLLEALGRIPVDTPLRVTLAGPGEPPALRSAAHEGVEWVGWLDPEAKDRLLRAAEIFVMPSRSEGLPMALLEAMAYGMAVVATDVGGIGDALGRGPRRCPRGVGGACGAGRRRCERWPRTPSAARQLGLAAPRPGSSELEAVEVAGRLAELYSRLG